MKQGKIHDLALATDAARLKVISDVTGANAFNSKIADCQRVIEGKLAYEKLSLVLEYIISLFYLIIFNHCGVFYVSATQNKMLKINFPSIAGADSKKAEIQKMLEELYERKDSLETEVEEQRSFIKCDQAKRAIEFVLHTRKIEEIQTSLDSVSPKYNKMYWYQIKSCQFFQITAINNFAFS